MALRSSALVLLLYTVCSFLSTTRVHAFSAPRRPATTLRRDPIGRITQLDRSKIDPSSDANFYARPNLVTHADEQFIAQVTNLYNDVFLSSSSAAAAAMMNNNSNNHCKSEGLIVLDIMSSHVSHIPAGAPLARLDVHGMNGQELEVNPARRQTNGAMMLRNLNDNPSFLGLAETAVYDLVLCCCSVQYLQEPEQVFAEVGRLLKPGGTVVVTFTNRFFPQKALNGWIERAMKERARLVTDYLRAAGGFVDIQVLGDGTSPLTQLWSVGGLGGDPFVAVVGTRDDSP